MKETLKALIAGLGCTPLLAVILLLAGGTISRIDATTIPAPPLWLAFAAVLFPVFFGLYLHTLAARLDAPGWLEQWRNNRRRKVVGHTDASLTVEDAWLQTELKRRSSENAIKTLLENRLVWGLAALLTFLPLAYICLWYGLVLAQR